MHHIDDCFDVVHRSVLQNAMTKIKNVSRSAFGADALHLQAMAALTRRAEFINTLLGCRLRILTPPVPCLYLR